MVIIKSLGTGCAEFVLIFPRPFFIQFPVAIIGLALVIWKLPEPKPRNVLESRHYSNKASTLQRIDFAGAFALVAVIVSGLLSVDVATKRGWSWLAAVLVSCFGGSVFAFIAIEKYYAREPIFPLKLLTNKDVLTSYAVIFFQAAGQFGVSVRMWPLKDGEGTYNQFNSSFMRSLFIFKSPAENPSQPREPESSQWSLATHSAQSSVATLSPDTRDTR